MSLPVNDGTWGWTDHFYWQSLVGVTGLSVHWGIEINCVILINNSAFIWFKKILPQQKNTNIQYQPKVFRTPVDKKIKNFIVLGLCIARIKNAPLRLQQPFCFIVFLFYNISSLDQRSPHGLTITKGVLLTCVSTLSKERFSIQVKHVILYADIRITVYVWIWEGQSQSVRVSDLFTEWLPKVQSGQNDSACYVIRMLVLNHVLLSSPTTVHRLSDRRSHKHTVVEGKYYQPSQGFLFTSSAVEFFCIRSHTLCKLHTFTHTPAHTFICNQTCSWVWYKER